MPTFSTTHATAGSDPTGYYGTLCDVQDAGGKKNVVTYSNLDGVRGQLDAARLQKIMAQVDDRISFYLRSNGVAKPTAGSDGFTLLTDGWALMVLAKTYRGRGDLDVENSKQGRTHAQEWYEEGRALIEQYLISVRGQNITKQFKLFTP
ncbi:MAG TPA: hypothetical protein VF595_05410 [Tepidisphaeraceae bacterium]|jgi:hypothetical protein